MQGTWNLHNALLDTQLDFFVLLGSTAGVVGNAGQTAYSASNSFMDAFSAYRSGLNLPSSTIDIGLIQDVGYVAEHKERMSQISGFVHDRLRENEFLAILEATISDLSPNCDYRQTTTGLKLLRDKSLPPWASEPRFVHILRSVFSSDTQESRSCNTVSLRGALAGARSLDQASHLICDAMIDKFSAISMTPRGEISKDKPLVAYGLDSLVGVEIRNWISTELEVNLPILELMTSNSLVHLSTMIVEKSTILAFPRESGEESDKDGEGSALRVS